MAYIFADNASGRLQSSSASENIANAKMDIVAHALNCIMNAIRAGKSECVVPASGLLKRLLEIMARNGYVKWEIQKDRWEKIRIFDIKLNKCGVIKPRFHVTVGKKKKTKNIEKYIRRYLPARELGILLISTSKGILTHKEAIEQHVGGSLLAYCY